MERNKNPHFAGSPPTNTVVWYIQSYFDWKFEFDASNGIKFIDSVYGTNKNERKIKTTTMICDEQI